MVATIWPNNVSIETDPFDFCALDKTDMSLIKNATQFSMPTGGLRFKAEIEKILQRRIGCANRGRPRVKVQ